MMIISNPNKHLDHKADSKFHSKPCHVSGSPLKTSANADQSSDLNSSATYQVFLLSHSGAAYMTNNRNTFPLALWQRETRREGRWTCKTLSLSTVWHAHEHVHPDTDRECSCTWRASEQARTGRWMLTQRRDTHTAADYYTADNELMSSRRYEAAHISTRQQTGEYFGRRHAWHVRTVFTKQIKTQKLMSCLQSQHSEHTGRAARKLQKPCFVYRL